MLAFQRYYDPDVSCYNNFHMLHLYSLGLFTSLWGIKLLTLCTEILSILQTLWVRGPDPNDTNILAPNRTGGPSLLLMAYGLYEWGSGCGFRHLGVPWTEGKRGKEEIVFREKNRITWLKVNHKILDLEGIRKTNSGTVVLQMKSEHRKGKWPAQGWKAT